MIQRYFDVKPACDMLQDSGTWRPDTMSLSHCNNTLLGQIECYLAPITKQLFSLEGEHYATLSKAVPKVGYLLNKASSIRCSVHQCSNDGFQGLCSPPLCGIVHGYRQLGCPKAW